MNRAFAAALLTLSIAWTPPERTKEFDCAVNGLLPDQACTPGAVDTTDLYVICNTSTRTRRHVSEETRKHVFAEYGVPMSRAHEYEVDHLIPLEVGGSNDEANLWPEAAPGFHAKDRVENWLHDQVCSRRMAVSDAQRAIAEDWTAIEVQP